MFPKGEKVSLFPLFEQTLEIYNFANNVWNLLKSRLRIFLGWMVPPCCQKFRQQFWAHISATFSKIKFFFSIFAQNRHFRFFILSGMGVRLVKNFFWCDAHWFGVKPHGRPKSRTRPPRGVTNIFSSPIMDFGWNFIIKNGNSFLIELWDTVSPRIFHRISWNRVSVHFRGRGSPSYCQKYRQHFLSQILATIPK